MSTATMRLRRAGAGGLAAAVIAGTLVATAGSALAWSGSFVNGSVATPLPVIAPGTTGSGADISLGLPATWSIGDTMTVAINSPLCTDATKTVAFATVPTVSASLGTAATTTDKLPTFTTATQQLGAGCAAANKNTAITLTFTNNGTNSADGIASLKFTGHTFSVASGSTATSVGLDFSALNAGSTTTPGTIGTNVSDALIGKTATLSATPAVEVPGAAFTAPDITLSEDVAGAITGTSVTFTITGATVTNPQPTTAKATWSLQTGTTQPTVAYTAANQFTVSGLTGTSASNTTKGTLKVTGVAMTAAAVTPVTDEGVAITASASATGLTGTADGDLGVSSNIQRVGGSDRYYTAAALYNTAFTGTQTSIIIASGANFPDALSASALAGATSAGILLTDPASLPSPTQLAISAKAANLKTVFILGGTGAVSAAVQAKIQSLLPTTATIVRLGGADRYATNQLVNDYAASVGGMAKTAVVATGTVGADALSVGPEVVAKKFGLVITNPTSLSPAAAATLVNDGYTSVVIVGGTGAVSSNVESQIKALGLTVAYRLAGTDRTQTAAQIATWATLGVPAVGTTYAAQAALGFNKTTVHVARGDIFADALAAAPVAAKFATGGTVILLTINPTSLGTGAPAFVSGLATTTLTNGATPPVSLASNIGTVNGLGLGGAVTTAQLNSVALGILG